MGRENALPSLFDIVGPIMTGPSSSHTAGAVRIGLVPKTERPARGVGNAALEGAARFLIAPNAARQRHEAILAQAVHVPLHADPRFQQTFMARLALEPWM